MARPALALLLASLLLAGCSGTETPDAGSDPDAEPDAGPGPGTPGADPSVGAGAQGPEPILAMADCWATRTSLPVDYSSAQDLLPVDLTAASWIGPGDETFAMVDLVSFDCASSTLGGQATGPTILLFVEIPLEVGGALSGSNVFPVAVLHNNPAVAPYWEGKWPAHEGTLTRTTGPTSTVLTVAAGPITGVLETQVPDAVGGVGDASFLQHFGQPDGRRQVVVELSGMTVGLGGSAGFTGTGLPATSADGIPLTASAGLAVANGPLAAVTFTPTG